MRAFSVCLLVFSLCSNNLVAQDEKAVIVYERGARINKADIRKETVSTENILQIEALNVSGGSIALSRSNPILPPAEISNISSINGSYVMSRDISRSGRGVVMQLLNVIYPYRARITVSEQILEFEILEPGYWKVNIGLSQ